MKSRSASVASWVAPGVLERCALSPMSPMSEHASQLSIPVHERDHATGALTAPLVLWA